ncbi:MAG: hypothetical protein AAGK23_00470 [Pseudomonadota bacterium]
MRALFLGLTFGVANLASAQPASDPAVDCVVTSAIADWSIGLYGQTEALNAYAAGEDRTEIVAKMVRERIRIQRGVAALVAKSVDPATAGRTPLDFRQAVGTAIGELNAERSRTSVGTYVSAHPYSETVPPALGCLESFGVLEPE